METEETQKLNLRQKFQSVLPQAIIWTRTQLKEQEMKLKITRNTIYWYKWYFVSKRKLADVAVKTHFKMSKSAPISNNHKQVNSAEKKLSNESFSLFFYE